MLDETIKIQRVIQENVPGKQITLAHIIAKPDQLIYKKLGLNENSQSIGLINITPFEAAIIASDIAIKSGAISLEFVDRQNGSIIVTGDISSIDYSFQQVISTLSEMMGFSTCVITKT